MSRGKMPPEKTSRRYNSARRQEQARETRNQIITAARDLFFENGYAGTTIEAIASQAGVAAETIYAGFGSKLALLTTLIDQTIVGDDAPIPLLDRSEIRAIEGLTDPHEMLRKFAADITRIMQRMGPIFSLLHATAKSDEGIAALLNRLLSQRLQGMYYLVENLQRIGALRPDLHPDQAAETIWLISSAEVYNLYIDHAGKSVEQYQRWLQLTLERLLLA
jgi:AcrR family transcriptional regulator